MTYNYRSYQSNRKPNFKSHRFSRSGRGGQSSGSIFAFVKRASVQEITTISKIEVIAKKFSELAIDPRLKVNITARGYTELMPIQEKTIPAILDGKDVIGIANTGTGKTGAFLIPLVQKIINDSYYQALIITPTRELALQIREELQKMSRDMRIYSTLCIGQTSTYKQIADLRRHPHIVVGTPGRLKDLINRKALNLSYFKAFVLDEVDRMLDMGFVQDIKEIISFLPAKRQSLFFSATVSGEINKIIQSFVVNPVTISVKTQETTSHIQQEIVRIEHGETKQNTLQKLLSKEDFKKVLIFGRTKIGVERLSKELMLKGFQAVSIHGDKPQFKRQQAIRQFKEDAVKILVATDVAARGLDIENITHVINYDVPSSYEDYIHRIGRTGRANKLGIALTLVEG